MYNGCHAILEIALSELAVIPGNVMCQDAEQWGEPVFMSHVARGAPGLGERVLNTQHVEQCCVGFQ